MADISSTRRTLVWSGLILAAVPLLFYIYTGQVWEDFLITFRTAHNLATGHGLSFNQDTRIYSLTSPLNTLLPALYDWMTGSGSYQVPLQFYILTSLAAYVAGGVLLVWLQASPAGVPLARVRWVFPVLFALCLRTTPYVVNGQEAGFWTLGLALAFTAVVRGMDRSWLLAGSAWTLLMWIRPDSSIHIALFSAIALLTAVGDRRSQWTGILKAAGVCTLGYLPWFIIAWVYYGTPFSLTMRAKFGAFVGPDLPWTRTPALERVRDGFAGAFDPIYSTNSRLYWVTGIVGIVAALAWLLPRASRLTRLASLAFLGSVIYLEFVWTNGTAFPWYFVPASLFGSLTLACLLDEFRARGRAGALWAARALVLTTLVLQVDFFVVNVPVYAAKQHLVDERVRLGVGLWLRDHVKANEHVYLEPAGYIGYYSGVKLYDYPGLTEPAVIELRRTRGDGFYGLIRDLKPEWLVLRSVELAGLRQRPDLYAQYHAVAAFNNDAEIKRVAPQYFDQLYYDSHFTILNRNTGP